MTRQRSSAGAKPVGAANWVSCSSLLPKPCTRQCIQRADQVSCSTSLLPSRPVHKWQLSSPRVSCSASLLPKRTRLAAPGHPARVSCRISLLARLPSHSDRCGRCAARAASLLFRRARLSTSSEGSKWRHGGWFPTSHLGKQRYRSVSNCWTPPFVSLETRDVGCSPVMAWRPSERSLSPTLSRSPHPVLHERLATSALAGQWMLSRYPLPLVCASSGSGPELAPGVCCQRGKVRSDDLLDTSPSDTSDSQAGWARHARVTTDWLTRPSP